MELGGYILLWKKFLDTSFFGDSVAVHLAIYLLLRANWEDQKVIFNKQEIIIERGQLITGRNQISDSLRISPSTIRNKLFLLKKLGFLDSKSNNKFSIITICKYEDYQVPINGDRTAKVTTSGQQEDSQNEKLGQQTSLIKIEKTGQQRKIYNPKTGQQEKTENPKIGHRELINNNKEINKLKHNIYVGLKTSDPFINEIIEFWNLYVPKEIPKIIRLSEKRIKNLKSRIEENPELSDWKKAIRRIFASDFCKGQSPGSSWRISFGWVIKNPDNFLKCLEGNYNNPPYTPKTVGFLDGERINEDRFDELNPDDQARIQSTEYASLKKPRGETAGNDDFGIKPGGNEDTSQVDGIFEPK